MNPQITGFAFAIAAFVIFAGQDAVSKLLGETYPPVFITMIRYWAFGAFAVSIALAQQGGARRSGVAGVAVTARPVLQVVRGLLLATQIITGIMSFTLVGLIHTQAIFTAGPLVIAALSVPVLGERVGWRRWTAIVVGMAGVLVMILPGGGAGEVSWITLLLPVACVVLGAVYAVLTRLANRTDSAMTSFFYTGVVGAVAMTLVGPFFWMTPTPIDWLWFALLGGMGIASHYCLIRAYHVLDAVKVQPISYLQLVVGAMIGVTFFNEVVEPHIVIGALIVIAAGLFTVWREAIKARAARLG